MKKIEYNFRSACALGIISCFVLFLTASAPHRVHHLFENLRSSAEIIPKQNRPLSLTAYAQAVDTGNHGDSSHHHLAKDGHHGHDHEHHSNHRNSSRGNNHKHDHGEQDHRQLHPQAVNTSHSYEHLLVSDTPLHANNPHDDAHHDNSAQTVCLLQVAAQQSHLSSVELLDISFLGIEIERRASRLAAAFPLYNPSPFSQRAPPTI